MRAQDTTCINRPSPQVIINTPQGRQVHLEVLNRKKVQGEEFVLVEVPNGPTLTQQAFKVLRDQRVEFIRDDELYREVMRELSE